MAGSLGAQFRIDTVAGGYIPNGVPAVSSPIDPPIAVTTDPLGNYYIAVPGSNRIFQVDTSGLIRPFAGDGASAFRGDGGPATAASLSYPTGLAADSDNLYIAENGNHRVRKVSFSTGLITTLAGDGRCTFGGDGGPASSASLCFPSRATVDGSGNLYIAEINNHRVRKVVLSTGVISTVAGNGACNFTGPNGDGGPASGASFCFPSEMAADSAGNLYISESGTNRVRKINLGAGTISTIAGNGTCSFGGDGGPATGAGVCSPTGLALDRTGNLYIAEWGWSRVRRVSLTSGVITTAAGTGDSRPGGDGAQASDTPLNGPDGLALDSDGNLYIAENNSNRIRKIALRTGIITTVAGSPGVFRGDGEAATEAALWSPFDVAIDGTQLYIAEWDNNRVRHVDLRTGLIRTVAGTGAAGFNGEGQATNINIEPRGVAKDGAGNLYVSDRSRIWRLNLGSGVINIVAGNGRSSFGGDGGPALAASLDFPTGLALDGKGSLYFADTKNNRVRKIDLRSGIISTVAGTAAMGYNGDGGAATGASLNNPWGLALDDTGNLYVADEGNHRVRRIDLNTGIINTVAGNGTAGSSGDGGPATSARLSLPDGVALDGGGNLLIAEYGSHLIRQVNLRTGIISAIAGGIGGGFSGDGGLATFARLRGPAGLTVDADGVIYIADSSNNRIRRLTPPRTAVSLTLSRAILNFQTTAAAEQIVTVGSSGAALAFTATASTSSSWLSVSPASGSTPATLAVGVNPEGLEPGSYTGMVTVAASAASNTPQRIVVNLTVDSAPGQSPSVTQVNGITARISHTATTLRDGRILLAGSAVFGLEASAQLFDPATGAFATTGSLNAGRSGHSATLLQDGTVLIAGGGAASAEIYDPATGKFTAVGSLATMRMAHGANLVQNGKVLLCGGFPPGGGITINSCELYDPATRSFSAAANLLQSRAYSTVTPLGDGRLLFIGGIGATAETYDPSTGIFARAASMRTQRYRHTATLLPGGQVLVTAGHAPGPGSPGIASAELYDPGTDTWAPAGDLAEPRGAHTATLLNNGKVLIAGGIDGTRGIAALEIFDPETRKFSRASLPLNVPHSGHTASLLGDGRVLIVGGIPSPSVAELYAPGGEPPRGEQ